MCSSSFGRSLALGILAAGFGAGGGYLASSPSPPMSPSPLLAEHETLSASTGEDPDLLNTLETLAVRVAALEGEPRSADAAERARSEGTPSAADVQRVRNPLELRERALAHVAELTRTYEAQIAEEAPDPVEAKSLQSELGAVVRGITEAHPSKTLSVESARCAESLCSFWVEHDEAETLHQLLVQGVFAGPLAGGTVTTPHESGRGTTVYVKRRL